MNKVGICLFALAVGLPVVASETHQKPGRWEVTMEMEMAGMPMKMPPVVTNVCLTKEDVENPERALPQASKDAQCKISDYKSEGNVVTWKIACAGATPMTGTGKITYVKDTYDGQLNMTMSLDNESHDVSAHFKGKFQGECDGTEMNRKK